MVHRFRLGEVVRMFVFRVLATEGGVPIFCRFDHVGLALEKARCLLGSGAKHISIRNNQGDHIEGAALEDCCRNAEGIQNNLKPVKL